MENNNIGNAERAGKNVKFERIRRITGYLVGTVDRGWRSFYLFLENFSFHKKHA